MKGYHGRFLEVDLDRGTCRDLVLEEGFYRKYLGGATLAAALVYPRVEAGCDPLAPASPLVMATGPLVGTPLPMVSRYAVAGVSPLTGFWGEATSGGVFPFRLKGSGWDGIIVSGRAAQPVYLHLRPGRAELKSAAHLWGLDTYQTQRALKKELGGREGDLSVACIGPAGEKLLPFAGIMNDKGRAAGRCGLGALMGSKNLKAVAAAGKQKPALAHPGQVARLARQAVAGIKGNLISLAFKEYGTLMYMDMALALGDAPARYFGKSVFKVEPFTGRALRRRYRVKSYACRGCPVGCGRDLKDFRPGQDVDGPEYETVAAFGPLCLNQDLEAIIEANHLCNQQGLDTISTGVSIAYAMYLYEQGALDQKQVGFELRWGDGRAVLELVRMICRQEGMGRLLGRGTLAMARALGRDPEEAAQVKGLEMPMHDPRAFHGQALSYATGPRGACHLKGDYYNVELGAEVPEYSIQPGLRLQSAGKGEAVAKYQSLKDLYDALTMCKFSPLPVSSICRMLGAVTGWDFDPESFLTAGNRSLNLKRALNHKLGLGREHDRLPGVCLRPLDEGTTAGSSPDMESMLQEYYDYRGWDRDTGRPRRDTLLALGLEHIAAEMYP